MTTMAQLGQANVLNNELAQVNAAISALAAKGAYTAAFTELQIDGAAGFRFQITPTTAQVNTFLTNRQTALTNALAALGVTS